VPWVIELGGDPDLLARYTRVLDALTNLLLVSICKSGINVPVAGLNSRFDSFANLARLALPRS